MQISVLGCSGGVGQGLRTTSYLIGNDILLDGGTGVEDLSIDEMLSVRHVLLTHAHLDHIAGLALMLASVYDKMVEPITIYAPESVLSVLKESLFNWKIWPDFTELPDTTKPSLKLQPLVEGTTTRIKGFDIEPVLLSHTIDSYAYIIKSSSVSLCFFGDTGPTDKIWQILNQQQAIDNLIIEASFPNEQHQVAQQSGHYTPALLAKDLEQLNTHPTVHIHHIKPGFEEVVIEQCNELLAGFDVNIVSSKKPLELK